MSDDPGVLIIDDDDMVRRAFRRILGQNGFTVYEADDGEEGLRQCRELRPGVVLLDLRMPHMDGLDVLSALVTEHPDTPVIVVSGQGTMTDAVEALRRGAWDFVSKPIGDIEFLLRAVRRGLERAALLRQNREYSESLRLMNTRLTAALEELRNDARAARQLQFQLLPPDGLRVGSFVCSRRLFPSQVLSGDFLDYFPLGSGFLGFYLADVAGHGAASAFVTAILKTLVAKHRESLRSRGDETILHPAQLLKALDADLLPLGLAKHVTLFYGVIDLDSGRLAYANAGAYPFPFLCSGSEVVELETPGRPLNLPMRGEFGTGETRLSPNGRLLLLSDGILELGPRRPQRERRDAIGKLLRRATKLGDVLEALGLSDEATLSDDIAVLFLHREENHA